MEVDQVPGTRERKTEAGGPQKPKAMEKANL